MLGGPARVPQPWGHPARPWHPERGHTAEPPAGSSLADLLWVWGCAASWQAGNCLGWDKSFAHRSLVSLEMPPAFIFVFEGFLFCFLLCAAERKPFRRACSQTLKQRGDGTTSSAGASESGLCSSFLCCSLIKPLTSAARGPSISCLPKKHTPRMGGMCQGTCQRALEFGGARQQLQVGSLQNSGVTEWFGRDTLKLISFHPLSWAGMPSPRLLQAPSNTSRNKIPPGCA